MPIISERITLTQSAIFLCNFIVINKIEKHNNKYVSLFLLIYLDCVKFMLIIIGKADFMLSKI